MSDEPTVIEALRHNLISYNKILDLLSEMGNTRIYNLDQSDEMFSNIFETKTSELFFLILGQMKMIETVYNHLKTEEDTQD